MPAQAAQGTWGWSFLMLTSCVTMAWAGHHLDNGILTVPAGTVPARMDPPGPTAAAQLPLCPHTAHTVPIMSPSAGLLSKTPGLVWMQMRWGISGFLGFFLYFLQSINLFCFKGIQSLELPLHDSSQTHTASKSCTG